jgi:hypothetical protein
MTRVAAGLTSLADRGQNIGSVSDPVVRRPSSNRAGTLAVAVQKLGCEKTRLTSLRPKHPRKDRVAQRPDRQRTLAERGTTRAPQICSRRRQEVESKGVEGRRRPQSVAARLRPLETRITLFVAQLTCSHRAKMEDTRKADGFTQATFQDLQPRQQTSFAWTDPSAVLPPAAADKLWRLQQDAEDKRALLPDFDERRAALTERVAAAARLKRLQDPAQSGGFNLSENKLSVVVAK